MKIVIYSGPMGSGKSYLSRKLQETISSNPADHAEFRLNPVCPDRQRMKQLVEKQPKTILMDYGSAKHAKNIAEWLCDLGYKGTFIATTAQGERVIEAEFKGFGSSVTVHYLDKPYPPEAWSLQKVKAEAYRLAKEYNGIVLECRKKCSVGVTAYKVVFQNSQMEVKFKNRDGGML